jgi:hypothetical protein
MDDLFKALEAPAPIWLVLLLLWGVIHLEQMLKHEMKKLNQNLSKSAPDTRGDSEWH